MVKKEEKNIKENFNFFDLLIWGSRLFSILMIIISCLAIYYSFKCNNGINIIDLLFATFCAPCSLFLRLITGCGVQQIIK